MSVLGSVSAMDGAIAGPTDGVMPVPKTLMVRTARRHRRQTFMNNAG